MKHPFKTILCCLLSALLALAGLPALALPAFADFYGVYVCGTPVNDGNSRDVLGDGAETIADVTVLLNALSEGTTDQLSGADLDENGTVSIGDVTALLNILAS